MQFKHLSVMGFRRTWHMRSSRGCRGAAQGGVVFVVAACGCLSATASIWCEAVFAAQAVEAAGAISDAPLADPVVDAKAELRGARVAAWSEGETRWLILDEAVSIQVGTYGFRAQRAVVRIDVEDRPGRRVHHLAAYLDQARPLRGTGPVAAEAPRLLVTCSTTGSVQLEADLFDQRSEAPDDELLSGARQRIGRHRDLLSRATLEVPPGPPLVDAEALASRDARRKTIRAQASTRLRQQIPAGRSVLPEPAAKVAAADAPPDTAAATDATSAQRRARRERTVSDAFSILPAQGTVLFNAQNVVRPGPEEYGQNMLLLFGEVTVVYQDRGGDRTMALRARRAVVFLAPDAMTNMADRKAAPSDVLGVYLEDNVVATDGEYTIRAPRVYYDTTTNKAVVLNAVFYAWDVRRKVPIYMRAQQLRQEARNSWRAPKALLTTSEFAEPHFAIGARNVTFRQRPNADGTTTQRFTASHITPEVWGVPVLYWPYVAANAQEVPLRKLSGQYRNKSGMEVESRWDLFALAGQPRPDGVDLTGQVDYLGDRGPAVGLNLDYERLPMSGFLDSYLLMADSKEDDVANLRDVPQDGDSRGYALWRHRQYLQDKWELSLEAAYVSDPTFLSEFFRTEAERSKPYETSVYLKKQEDDTAFTLLTQYDLLDFTAQTTPLQSPGYTTEKLPELAYYVIGRELLDNRLTYYGEARATRMRIRVGKESPSDRGFSSFQSALNFAIPMATTDFDDALDATGVPSDSLLRFDTRHEVQAPLELGPLDVVPYLAGRITVYDDDFDKFSAGSDSDRLWGSVGLRLHTDFSKTSEDVEIRALDVHRLKHIIEPTVDLSLAGATLNPEDIPVFDRHVEGIREGTTARFGLRNTLQTQRGGPGQWRTVDWLVVNTDLVLASDDTDVATPVARYIGFRPELSTGGDHFHSDVMWMINDTLAAIAEVNQNIETSQVDEWRLGSTLQHTPQLRLHMDVAEIDPLASRLFSYGFTYQLTRKYRLLFSHRLDLEAGGTRSVVLRLRRQLPRWSFEVTAAHDDIDDEQTISVVLIPDGAPKARALDVFDSRARRE